MAEPKSKSGVVMFTNSQKGLELATPVVNEALGEELLASDWIK